MEIEKYIAADDRMLVQWVLQDDHAAFEHLFDRYHNAIHRLFMQRTGNRSDADDLLQEAFIKIFINLHRYNPDFTFGQWAYTIARNTFIDFARKRQENLSLNDQFASAPSFLPSPEEHIINKQQRAQIDRSLAQLPELYRRLVTMRFFDGYSYEEIAEKMEMPLGTVKTRLHRVREQIFNLLVKEE